MTELPTLVHESLLFEACYRAMVGRGWFTAHSQIKEEALADLVAMGLVQKQHEYGTTSYRVTKEGETSAQALIKEWDNRA